MFEGVKRGDINVDELDVAVLISRSARSCEVAIACADSDNQVSLCNQTVGCRCAGRANRAEVLRVAPIERTYARLRHTNWNSRGFNQPLQNFVSV